MKIEKLTKDQEDLINEVRDEWLNRFFSCQPTDEKAASKGIELIYKMSNLEKPLIYFVDSPLAAQILANSMAKNQAMAQLWNQVWNQVWDQVWYQVRAQVRDQVRAQVRAQAMAQVWDQVRAQVRDQVRAQVMDQVRAQARDQVRAQFLGMASPLSSYDFDYLSWADFYSRIKISKLPDLLLACLEGGRSNFYDAILLNGFAIVVRSPEFIMRNQQNRLHNEFGMSIKFRDGWGLYNLHGVRFDEALFKKVTGYQIDVEGVFAIKNIERRMAAMKFLGDALPIDSAATLVSKDKGYELFSINLGDDPKLDYFLKYSCPSTGRIYRSFVPPEVGEKCDAIEAISWKFGLDRSSWDRIEKHT